MIEYPKYQISNKGHVRNKKTLRILKSTPTEKGRWRYHQVTIRNKLNEKKVVYNHRLVAEYFVPNPNNYPIVTFKDKNIHNLVDTNLVWVEKIPF